MTSGDGSVCEMLRAIRLLTFPVSRIEDISIEWDIIRLLLVVHVTCMSSCCYCSSPNSVRLRLGHRFTMGWMDVKVVGVCLG